MNDDGSWTPFEVPGPANFSAWEACWKVYCAILLMLPPVIEPITGEEVPFVTIQGLENYYEYFKQIVKENVETWFLCCRAEDRCRGEHPHSSDQAVEEEAHHMVGHIQRGGHRRPVLGQGSATPCP